MDIKLELTEDRDQPMSAHAAPATQRTLPVGKVALLAVFAIGVAAFFYFDAGQYLTLASLKENKDALRAYTEANYAATVLLFIAVYCLQTALSLPGAAVLTLSAGFLFGTVLGTVYVNLAATSGATLAFLAARYLFRDGIQRKFGAKLESIQRGFDRNAFHYLLTLRLIPLFPFFLVNLASGLTRIRLSTYVLATAIGILPGSVVFSNAGSQLGTINSLKDVASPGVLGSFVLLGILALVPVVYQKLKKPAVA
ncbi:MAG: TVP38/TMEM64 family protein [Nitrospirota bacterium]